MRMYVPTFLMAFAYLANAKDFAPTFSLSEERSIGGAPKINVKFQNGVSDSLILSTSERDRELFDRTGNVECRYFGHLENEPDACAVMTGCVGLDDLEFTILSKNIQESPAFVWTREGSVEIVNVTSNYTHFHDSNGYLEETLNYPAEMRANPPPAMQVGLRIGYGDLFKQKVANPEQYIRNGMAHAQAYYCHSSFGSQIDLHYPIIEHVPGFNFRSRASDDTSSKWEWDDLESRMRKLTADTLGDMDLRVYVGYDTDQGDRVSGIASVGVVCESSGYNPAKWSINEYAERVSSFGSTVAHEMGHNLGLRHDFGLPDTSCNCEGIMSYNGQYGCPINLPAKWSHCSKNSFAEHYNKVVGKGLQWCMASFNSQTAPSCSTSKLCNTATFNDGVCDDINNREICSFDGGDCCDYKAGWDARCKENNGDCTCKEECKDGNSGTSTNFCGLQVTSSGCNNNGCTSNGVQTSCGSICKRLCYKCDATTCKDVGTIMGNYGDNFCADIVKNGLCDKTNAACGKENCGDLCRKSCNKCTPPPLPSCRDEPVAGYNNFCGSITAYGLCNANHPACGSKKCGEFCRKSCGICTP